MPSFIGHQQIRDALERSIVDGRVRHAYLLYGPGRVGKTAVARWLAMRLNCPNQPAPCGTCRSCRRIASGTHPDVRSIQPASDKSEGIALPLEPADATGRSAERSISIAQIRALQHDAALSANEAPWKVYLILGAETMQIAAANSLLKTLEEPPSRVVLLLTAGDTAELLPTIVSRCQVVRLALVPTGEISSALQTDYACLPERADLLARLAGGRPGWAVQALSDPELLSERNQALDDLVPMLNASFRDRFALAEKLATSYSRDHGAVLQRLALWQVWWWDVLLVQRGCSDLVSNPDRFEVLRDHAGAISPAATQSFVGAIADCATQLVQNVNARLALENLLLACPMLPSLRW